MNTMFGQWIWSAIAALVALWGGLFSLGLWSAGVGLGGYWHEGAYLGLVLFAVSIGLGAMIHLLSRLAANQGKP